MSFKSVLKGGWMNKNEDIMLSLYAFRVPLKYIQKYFPAAGKAKERSSLWTVSDLL